MAKTSKGKKVPKKAKRAKDEPAPASAEACYEQAEIAYLSEDVGRARVLFTKAVQMDPENPDYLEGFGAFLAEEGHPDEAVSLLQRAVLLAPDASFEKYMYLGQLMQGSDAEMCLRKGIQVIRAHLVQAESSGADPAARDDAGAVPEAEHLRDALSSALCALAEHVTAAAARAAEEAAEQAAAAGGDGAPPPEAVLPEAAGGEAESLLREAASLLPASPEPAQALAALRLAQDRGPEALAAMDESLAKWLRPEEEGEEGEDAVMDDDLAASGSTPEAELPAFEFRVQAAKLLLSFEGARDEQAIAVLEGCVEENDSVPLVWLLLADAYARAGEAEAALEASEEGLAAVKGPAATRDPETPAFAEALASIADEARARIAAASQ